MELIEKIEIKAIVITSVPSRFASELCLWNLLDITCLNIIYKVVETLLSYLL
jgi:hypothetical protein